MTLLVDPFLGRWDQLFFPKSKKLDEQADQAEQRQLKQLKNEVILTWSKQEEAFNE